MDFPPIARTPWITNTDTRTRGPDVPASTHQPIRTHGKQTMDGREELMKHRREVIRSLDATVKTLKRFVARHGVAKPADVEGLAEAKSFRDDVVARVNVITTYRNLLDSQVS